METEQTKTAKKRWPDRTQTQRTARRREKLNVIAKQHGFDTWARLETACLNGATLIVIRENADFDIPEYSQDDNVYQLVSGAGTFSRDGLAVIVPIPEAHGAIS